MHLPEETKVTRKFLRESMTSAQFEAACQHYNEMLKRLVEEEIMAEDVPDYPPPDAVVSPGEAEPSASFTAAGKSTASSEPTSSFETRADDMHATPSQLTELKRLAQQVGDDAYADVQDVLEHHPEGLALGVYELAKQRLEARKADKKAKASGKRSG
jgi:hypothetical protein